MRWFGANLTAALIALLCAAPVSAQETSVAPEQAAHAILIVDLDRALRESAPGQALAAAIQKQRLAIHQSTVDLDKAMEAEETEIDQIRDRLTPQQFEERLRDFDQRVRQVRSERQNTSQAFNTRITAARRRLAQALNLILRDILEERGASVLLNGQNVIMAREEIDITSEAIDRFSTQTFEFDLSPLPSGDGG